MAKKSHYPEKTEPETAPEGGKSEPDAVYTENIVKAQHEPTYGQGGASIDTLSGDGKEALPDAADRDTNPEGLTATGDVYKRPAYESYPKAHDPIDKPPKEGATEDDEHKKKGPRPRTGWFTIPFNLAGGESLNETPVFVVPPSLDHGFAIESVSLCSKDNINNASGSNFRTFVLRKYAHNASGAPTGAIICAVSTTSADNGVGFSELKPYSPVLNEENTAVDAGGVLTFEVESNGNTAAFDGCLTLNYKENT